MTRALPSAGGRHSALFEASGHPQARPASRSLMVVPRFSSISELEEFLASNADGMAADILRHASDSRERRQSQAAEVADTIRSEWSDGLDMLDAAVFAMGQHGLFMLNRLDEVDRDSPNDSHQIVRIVLALLQFSATITLQEIRTLLEAGFWSAGAARWRALHELAVTAKLVAGWGPTLAQRYMDHGYVVQTRRLKAYSDEHGVGPVAPTELDARMVQTKALETKHSLPGEAHRFRDPYGWALTLMPLTSKGRRVRPTMDELEKLADLDHRRLLVASSHGVIHADSGGIAGVVLLEDGLWLAGPTERFIETVARPTLDTLIHLVAATHLGFEDELNNSAEKLALFASGTMSLCRDAISKFDRDGESSEIPPAARE